ncbi:hypothetical protein ASU31_01735 [Pedobacter ginsenosidimutans]|uniref:Acyltransferase 3 domain-containing protein n=1 Tax=Pedobacter ginsenosidimutans TaxID=687842 RepID=A0A0T5VW41_9SPHI|nr:acyltransferase family protein [Pedobacter ginsenosidimutans]KRT18032.1 hypothetical protein ASU31_01735 [Pedobacter ginsenosidimutans]
MRKSFTEKNIQDRFTSIDYAKFIGIFLVVLGHQEISTNNINIIYAFHMPLFFFLSGFLFSFDKYKSYKIFLVKRFKQLIIPYFAFNIITYVFWLFVGRKFGANSQVNISLYKPIIGMFYGNGIDNYLIHCVPLWFLPCLFMVENIYFLAFRFLKHQIKYIMLAALVVLGFFDYKYQFIRLPWSFNIAIVAVTFYGFANIFREKVKHFLGIKMYLLGAISAICIFLVIYVTQFNGRVDMNGRVYGNYSLFYIAAFAGIGFIISISELMARYIGSNKFVGYIAQNTLIIFALHFIIMSVIKGFVYFVLKIPLSSLENNIGGLSIAITTIIVIIPIIYVINRFFPFILGKSYR